MAVGTGRVCTELCPFPRHGSAPEQRQALDSPPFPHAPSGPGPCSRRGPRALPSQRPRLVEASGARVAVGSEGSEGGRSLPGASSWRWAGAPPSCASAGRSLPLCLSCYLYSFCYVVYLSASILNLS